MSAVKNLRIVAKIKDLDKVEERIEKVLKIVNLTERKDSNFKTYSLGMKQRLAIAAALLSDPEVLVLDEPTNGLDPQGIAEIRNLIIEIAGEGKTILIASHQLDEIEKVCTDVVILKKGVVIAQDNVENITSGSKHMVIMADDMAKAKSLVDGFDGIDLVEEKQNRLFLNVKENIKAADVNKYFFENGVILSELRLVKKSLESQFLEMTK